MHACIEAINYALLLKRKSVKVSTPTTIR